jgi:hypothetical protein
MEKKKALSLPVYLLVLGTISMIVIGAALYIKGDVKASVKMPGIEFFIDAKDHLQQKH